MSMTMTVSMVMMVVVMVVIRGNTSITFQLLHAASM
jgi:hypothetical protein